MIGSPGAGTSRASSGSPQGPPQKRARPDVAGPQGERVETLVINEGEEDREAETGGEGTDAETWVPARDVPWAPEVRHYAGRLITCADSAATNIGTAYGLLQSAILPRDARAVKGLTEDLCGEAAQALLAVSCCYFVVYISRLSVYTL